MVIIKHIPIYEKYIKPQNQVSCCLHMERHLHPHMHTVRVPSERETNSAKIVNIG